jgi:hypothetical protein
MDAVVTIPYFSRQYNAIILPDHRLQALTVLIANATFIQTRSTFAYLKQQQYANVGRVCINVTYGEPTAPKTIWKLDKQHMSIMDNINTRGSYTSRNPYIGKVQHVHNSLIKSIKHKIIESQICI